MRNAARQLLGLRDGQDSHPLTTELRQITARLAAALHLDTIHSLVARAAAVLVADLSQVLTARASMAPSVEVPLAQTARAAAAFSADPVLTLQDRGRVDFGFGLEIGPARTAAAPFPEVLHTMLARGQAVILVDPTLPHTARGALAMQPDVVVAGKNRTRPANTVKITIEDMTPAKDAWFGNAVGCTDDANHDDQDLRVHNSSVGAHKHSIVGWDLAGLSGVTRVTRAEVKMKLIAFSANLGASLTITAMTIAPGSETWAETTVKCSNAPTGDREAARTTVQALGDYTWSLDQDGLDAIKLQIGVGSFSLRFEYDDVDNADATFEDRESGATVGPRLTMDLELDIYPTTTLNAAKDCLVLTQPGSGCLGEWDVNQNGSNLTVEDTVTADKWVYIAWDLSGLSVNAVLEKAELTLSPTGLGTEVSIGVHGINAGDEGWGETTIGCSNKPNPGAELQALTDSGANSDRTFALNASVLAQLQARVGLGHATLVLKMKTTLGTRTYYRREDAANRPAKLKLTYYPGG